MKVLELGCGFGALADLIATEYGVEITGVTLSEEPRLVPFSGLGTWWAHFIPIFRNSGEGRT